MKLALVLLAALLLAGCGSSSARPPSAAAPTIKNGPPASWLETNAGSRWLGYSSYCWTTRLEGNKGTGICADFLAPKCSQMSVPKLSVQRGETVRAHLGFQPLEASVDHARATLEGTTVNWRVQQAGPFLLFAKAKDGDASYVGCAVLR
jgi:hypothetical protein